MEAVDLLRQQLTKKIATCNIHGDYTAFCCLINGKEVLGECPACAEAEQKAAEAERSAEMRERMRQNEHGEAFRRACIPPRFTGKSFKDFAPHSSETAKAKEILGQFVVNWKESRAEGKSFLITGSTGTGKTHLACAVANNVIRQGGTAVYVSCLNYLSKVKSAWAAGSEDSEDAIIESYVAFDLMVLDELGKGTLDAKERGMIFRLIDRRYEEQRPILGISKIPEAALVKLIDDDAIRRLKAGGGHLEFGTTPFRR